MWLRNLFVELGYKIDTPFPLYMGNQFILLMARNLKHHEHIKQLDLRFYWLKDVVSIGLINIQYIPTKSMPADIITKALECAKVLNSY